MKIKEQIFFIQRLSFLTKADIPLLESLTIIREQTKSSKFKKILIEVENEVENGSQLSKSLAQKDILSDFAIHIIESGESTGMLRENLEHLAVEMKKSQLLERKIIGAFIYPIIVVCATVGITGFLLVFLFPKIVPVFKSLHMTLPLSTKIVITISELFGKYGYWIFGTCFLIVIIFSIIKRGVKKCKSY